MCGNMEMCGFTGWIKGWTERKTTKGGDGMERDKKRGIVEEGGGLTNGVE